ncbi:integrase catalytic domain-containing protein [Nephila pilipes]|uniref:Integrase catalytic domain-containing protein n=1 Tax=Nephila pilipes TaxID=299642 RepID=A0A8X6R1V4_NEPPI|nr:integrase catalytic domain-containing protein [Nephila pilipes]
MPLHKWATNSAELRELWEKNGFSIETSSNSIGQNMINYKVLGISWDTDRGIFYFDIENLLSFISKGTHTKRFLLQIAGRIFDPLGLIAPYVIRLKVLIQNVWEMGLLWDQEMPQIVKKPFKEWCHELKDLPLVSIPRFYDFTDSNVVDVQLHSFFDSSKKTYGTVIYFRVVRTDGTISTSFVTSKSRVAPLKTLSLPRLELMGALLSARLCDKVSKTLKFEKSCFFHTDSFIVYDWIQREPFRFKPFVKNRIEEIQKRTEPSKWHHCPGKENPADILSRGISVRELKDSELWWHGPPWLKEKFWPKIEKQNVSSLNLELKSKFRDISQNEVILENREKLLNIAKFSSYLKLLRVTAFVFRYIYNIRNTLKKRGAVDTEELKKSEEYWIKETQKETYGSEIIDLEKTQKVSDCSKIRSLVPYLDDRQILRIKGRLEESELFLDEKQPILLPQNSKFTELLILREHTKNFHSGVTTTLDYPLHFAELVNKVSNRESLIKRKKFQTTLLKYFWNKWKTQYLLDLKTVHHFKSPNIHKDVKVDDVVLVEGSSKSKLLWDLGTIQETFQGRDGHVRACVVKTKKGLFRKPVQLIYPFELNE